MLRKLMRWFLPCRTTVTRNHLLIMVSSTTPVTWVKVEVTTWRKHHRTPNTTKSHHTSTDRSTFPIPETSPNSSNPKRVRSSAICGTSTCLFITWQPFWDLVDSRYLVIQWPMRRLHERGKNVERFSFLKSSVFLQLNIFSQHWSLICFWWIVSVMINYQ